MKAGGAVRNPVQARILTHTNRQAWHQVGNGPRKQVWDEVLRPVSAAVVPDETGHGIRAETER